MTLPSKSLPFTIACITLATLTITIIAFINTSLGHWRVDLTADQRYSISAGTINILENLPQEVTLTLYFSDEATRDLPVLRNYHQRIIELLTEYGWRADRRLVLQTIDPKPFSLEEDAANAAGVSALALVAGQPEMYFGLVAESNGIQESISFLHPQRENLLEYDLSQLIYRVAYPQKIQVGLISGLDFNGGFSAHGMSPQWVSAQQLARTFEIQELSSDFDRIDDNISLLLLVHPTGLTAKALYAIDQYALRGGKIVAFLDPYAEQAGRALSGGFGREEDSVTPFSELLANWGVRLPADQVVSDLEHTVLINLNGQRQRHPALLDYSAQQLDAEDAITANLDRLILSTVGYLSAEENATTTLTPLLVSSNRTGLIDTVNIQSDNPQQMFASIQESNTSYVLAARVQGTIRSAYPDGIAITSENNLSNEEDTNESMYRAEDTLVEGNIQMLIVADSDLLSDRLWVTQQNFFGQTLLQPFADNRDLLINAVENYSGNDDLLAIRGQRHHTRFFTRVEMLRRNAEARLRDQQELLQVRLQETEQRLSALQQNENQEEALTLSAEQEEALQEFSAERLAIRQQLRQVRHQLDRDIDTLGMTLKFANIGLVPLLITLLVLLRRLWKR